MLPVVASSSAIGVYSLIHRRRLHCRAPSTKGGKKLNVAIIGGGLGGTSTAYYLRQLWKSTNYDADALTIDVYEADAVGGRARTMKVGDSEFECGGSVIHDRNRYMSDFVDGFGLTKLTEASIPKNAASRSAICDGDGRFVFEESTWGKWATAVKMFRQYGLNTLRFTNYIRKMMTDFDNIYALQDEGQSFATVTSMLTAMKPRFRLQLIDTLYHETKMDFSLNMITQIFAAIVNCNYGQSVNTMPTFAGSVGLAGAGGNLWSVKGGNHQAAEALLKHSKAKLIPCRVTHVTNRGDSMRVYADNGDRRSYDVVICAAPLHQRSTITFANIDPARIPNVEYHRCVTTMVVGKINAEQWHRKDGDCPSDIISTDSSKWYKSVGLLHGVDGLWPERSHFKIFSEQPLDDQQLEQLVKSADNVKVKDWLAYPEYSCKEMPNDFVLAPRLYYANAIESAASAMEMAVIGGRNTALLLLQHLDRNVLDNPIAPKQIPKTKTVKEREDW